MRHIAWIQQVVAEYFGLHPSDLTGPDRHATVADARHIAIYLCREVLVPRPSYPELGRAFGGRDHQPVIMACRKIAARVEQQGPGSMHVAALLRMLRQAPEPTVPGLVRCQAFGAGLEAMAR